jgi:hypothetical protein
VELLISILCRNANNNNDVSKPPATLLHSNSRPLLPQVIFLICKYLADNNPEACERLVTSLYHVLDTTSVRSHEAMALRYIELSSVVALMHELISLESFRKQLVMSAGVSRLLDVYYKCSIILLGEQAVSSVAAPAATAVAAASSSSSSSSAAALLAVGHSSATELGAGTTGFRPR